MLYRNITEDDKKEKKRKMIYIILDKNIKKIIEKKLKILIIYLFDIFYEDILMVMVA